MRQALSLEALEVIDAIDRKGSYAAAAAVLNRVPSAISYTVQKLEQDLGVALFQKQGRRAELTQAGRVLVERGRDLLRAADDLAATTRQVATGWEPRLRIAIDTVVPVSLVLPVIDALYAQHEAIEIDLTFEVLGGTWEALIDNRADLAVGGVGDVPGHRGIQCEPWLELDYVFVAAPAHPLCAAPGPVAPEDILRYRSVIVSDTAVNRAALSRGILNRESPLYVPDMASKIAAHRCGLGVGFVPLKRVTGDLARGTLVRIELTEPRDPEQLMLAWKSANRGRALHAVLERLRGLELRPA